MIAIRATHGRWLRQLYADRDPLLVRDFDVTGQLHLPIYRTYIRIKQVVILSRN